MKPRFPGPFLFSILLATLLLFALIGVYGFYVIQQNLLAKSGESLALSASDIADKIDRLVLERIEDLQLIGSVLHPEIQDLEHITNILQQLKNTHPSFLSISFTNLQGRILASSNPSQIGQNVAHLPEFIEMKNRQFQHFELAKFPVDTGQKISSLIITQAVSPNPEPIHGTLIAQVPISDLEHFFWKAQQAIKEARHTQTPIEWQLLTKDGQIMLDSRLHEEGKVSLTTLDLPSAHLVTSGKAGFVEEIHKRRHVPIITGFAPSKLSNGSSPLYSGVLIRMDQSDVLPEIQSKIFRLGFWISLILLPLIGIVFWTARKVDLEHKKKLEAETKFSDIFENAPQGIFQTTPYGHLMNANPAMAKILGFGSAPELMESVTGLVQQLFGDSTQPPEILQKLEKQGSVNQFEFKFYRQDGLLRWGSGNIRSVKNESGIVRYLEGTVEDITDMKEAEFALLQLQKQLLLEQMERTSQVMEELGTAKNTLVTQTKLATLGQLSGTLAHELRNPLGAMRNAIFLLKRRSAQYDDQAKRYLDMLDEEVHNSDLIIQGLLAIAQGKDPIKQRVTLQETLDKLLREYPLPEGIFCHLDCQPDPFELWVDPTQIIHVFRNLFHNACQAMGTQGNIWVHAAYKSHEVEILISDTGPGITKENREQVFEPLYTTKAKGTGLGLTFCREIINHHGGTITSMEHSIAGANFRIVLPIYPASSAKNLEGDKLHPTP